jgi:hypothetical protein
VLLLISLLPRFKLDRIISLSASMLNERELMYSYVSVVSFCHSRTKCLPTTKAKIWNRTVIALFLYEIVNHRIMIDHIRPHVVDFQFSVGFLHFKTLVDMDEPWLQTVLSKTRCRNNYKKLYFVTLLSTILIASSRLRDKPTSKKQATQDYACELRLARQDAVSCLSVESPTYSDD